MQLGKGLVCLAPCIKPFVNHKSSNPKKALRLQILNPRKAFHLPATVMSEYPSPSTQGKQVRFLDMVGKMKMNSKAKDKSCDILQLHFLVSVKCSPL